VIDALEPRILFALSLALDEGLLTIGGTNSADLIVISRVEGNLTIAVNKSLFMMPTEEIQRINIKGLGGSDKISFGEGVNIAATIFGGDGNDLISGGDRSNRLCGEAGHDTLVGSTGRDQFIGGPGIDTADYSKRLDDLVITLDGKPNDGTPTVGQTKGEGDNVMSDVEVVIGGFGDDSITGSSKRDILRGGVGDDTLIGNDGDDLLVGGDGADNIRGGLGDDTIMAIDLDSTDTVDGGDGFDSVAYDEAEGVRDTILDIESEVSILVS
jgi:Ca2+-binding RTX toxin-like protein